mgnify:CR=1 FL=1
MDHKSDCATHNEPAQPWLPCDCGYKMPIEVAIHKLATIMLANEENTWNNSPGIPIGESHEITTLREIVQQYE